jgi:hypothetical protein
MSREYVEVARVFGELPWAGPDTLVQYVNILDIVALPMI